MLQFSATYAHPLAIRYPRSGKVLFQGENTPIEKGKWEYLYKSGKEQAKATIVASGERCLIIAMKVQQSLAKQGKSVDVVNARFVKPLDTAFLDGLTSEYVVTIEDNVYFGGLGSMICSTLSKLNKQIKIKSFAYRDEFIPQGKVAQLQSEYGVNCAEIENYLLEVL